MVSLCWDKPAGTGLTGIAGAPRGNLQKGRLWRSEGRNVDEVRTYLGCEQLFVFLQDRQAVLHFQRWYLQYFRRAARDKGQRGPPDLNSAREEQAKHEAGGVTSFNVNTFKLAQSRPWLMKIN